MRGQRGADAARDAFGTDIAGPLGLEAEAAAEEAAAAAAEAAARAAADLIIAMGLGDKSLADRLEECRAEGEPGIPVRELIGYMRDAAKAIDFLNRRQKLSTRFVL